MKWVSTVYTKTKPPLLCVRCYKEEANRITQVCDKNNEGNWVSVNLPLCEECDKIARTGNEDIWSIQ